MTVTVHQWKRAGWRFAGDASERHAEAIVLTHVIHVPDGSRRRGRGLIVLANPAGREREASAEELAEIAGERLWPDTYVATTIV